MNQKKRKKYFREKSLLDTDKTIENESGIEEIEIEDEKIKKTEDFMKKNQKKMPPKEPQNGLN